MSEDGLVAIHKIINNINDQDERIWRQTAAKKCLKKEIEKIEEQTKRYEIQMATLKKDPLQKKTKEISQSLDDNINDQLQIHKLLSLTLNAKSQEIERKEKELKSWDKRYKEVIADLEEAYNIKKTVLQSINPMYKKLMEINASQKKAEVTLKQLKATSERRQRCRKQLKMIREQIFHKTILNFVNAVIRSQKYDAVISKMKVLEGKKKEMVKEMFEAQEALKKLRVSNTKITSGMFAKRIPNLNMQPEMTNRNETSRFPDFNKLRRLNVDKKDLNQTHQNQTPNKPNLNEENIQPIPTPKKNPIPINRINILSNKTVALPPLKSILTKKSFRADTSTRSFGDISFNRSQNSQLTISQPESVKKLDSTLKSSQESNAQVERNQNIQQNPMEQNTKKELSLSSANITKPSDFLKNLKFTTQSNKPNNKSSPLSIQSSLKNQTQKASILKSQVVKRKLNESVQDDDFDTSLRKKEKNVNFASPIQQQIEINQVSSPEGTSLLSSPASIPSNRVMNASMEGNMWMSPSDRNDDEFQMVRPNFSFGVSNENQCDKNNSNLPQDPLFGGTNDAEPSFGFCFGGSSKASGGLWDFFG